MTLPEAAYRSEAPRLAAALSAEHVAGVYEDRLPAALPAVLALGCVVSVAQDSRARPLAAPWRLQDFRVRRRFGSGEGKRVRGCRDLYGGRGVWDAVHWASGR